MTEKVISIKKEVSAGHQSSRLTSQHGLLGYMKQMNELRKAVELLE